MIQLYKKDKNVNIIIWVYFWNLQRSNLYVLTRDVMIKRDDYFTTFYFQVLDDNMLEIYELNLIFMQNNVFIHTIKKVKK